MWKCTNCQHIFKADKKDLSLGCPACDYIGAAKCSQTEIDLISHIWAEFEQAEAEAEAEAEVMLQEDSDDCSQCDQCTCYGKPADSGDESFSADIQPIEYQPLSFHDLDINELVLLASIDDNLVELALQATEDEAAFNLLKPTVITEMQERFLHTFLDDCST